MYEIWKDIEGYEGLYQVSNFGNFRSLDRDITYSTGRVQRIYGQILNPSIQRTGYYTVGLYDNCHKCKTLSVHRLVAIHFLPNPNNLPEVNHIDGDKSNNNINNLEWVTGAQNIHHAYQTGLKKNSDSPQCKPVKLLNQNITFCSIEECARYLHVSSDTVHRKLNNRNVPKLKNIDLAYVDLR